MSEEGATYDAIRRKRADRPAGGNFLSAKGMTENATIDVTVTDVSVRAGYKPEGYVVDERHPEPEPEPYWAVSGDEVPPSKDGNPVLVKENSFMTDWLEEHAITDPVGRSFRLVVASYKGNRTFRVSKAL